MRTPAICLENIGKQYRLGPRESYKALRDVLTESVVSSFRRLGRMLTGQGNGNAPPQRNVLGPPRRFAGN